MKEGEESFCKFWRGATNPIWAPYLISCNLYTNKRIIVCTNLIGVNKFVISEVLIRVLTYSQFVHFVL